MNHFYKSEENIVYQLKYGEALKKFETDDIVCIVVRTSDGLRALTDNNFQGGSCGCCIGCDHDSNLIVEKVVNMETMEILYDSKINE